MLVATLAGHLSGIPQLHVGPPDWTVIARCALVAVSATCGHALIYSRPNGPAPPAWRR
jgi:hypothetical protein